MEEIAALGFTVSATPKSGALPYGVIGGRSNARWWLVPLNNRHVATSGLALFQPILPSARIIKGFASILNSVGLSSLWARNKVYISCPPVFSDLFDVESLSYSFFTGTESPHRKTAIQIMDNTGEIKGFAKLSKQKAVKQLIKYEGDFLEYAHSLHMKSAHIPYNLLNDEINEAAILVTDTQKTKYSQSPVAFTKHHETFLSELASKNKNGEQLHNSEFLRKITQQAEQFAHRLPYEWNKRLALAIRRIRQVAPQMKGDLITCHGDFTPWNTFMVGGKLYVFDWEYAKLGCCPGYDLIHFHLSLPTTRRQSEADTIRQIRKLIQQRQIAKDDAEAAILFLCYLCDHTLQYVSRERELSDRIITWEGEIEVAVLFDALLREHT